MLQRFRHFNKQRVSFFIFILLILSISSVGVVYHINVRQYDWALLIIINNTSLFLLPIYLFKNKLKWYLYLLIPVFVFLPINLASIILFSVPITDSSLLLVINTNVNEALELTKGYLLSFIIGYLLYILVVIYLIKKSPISVKASLARNISLVALCLLFLMPFCDTSENPYFTKFRTRFYTSYPISLVYSAKTVYDQNKLIAANKADRDSFKFNATADIPLKRQQIQVLIIGESARYDHWGINGYGRNTSPLLAKENNLITFSNVFSGGYITEYAVPLILTGVGADSFSQHYKQKSIVGAYNELGYKTYWISNQIDYGHIKLHISEAKEQYVNPSDFRATTTLVSDFDLLETLQRILQQPNGNKFIVLHTMGSHYDYSARYPINFDVFTPSNKTVFSKSADKNFKNVLINSYDNTILYTDALIDSVIGLVKKQNVESSVTYISDHGENLFDDDRNYSQHGAIKLSKYVAKVPMFIWYSPQLYNMYPEKIEALKAHKDATISSKNAMFTIASLGGITFNSLDATKNIASKYFVPQSPLIVGANSEIFKADSLQ